MGLKLFVEFDKIFNSLENITPGRFNEDLNFFDSVNLPGQTQSIIFSFSTFNYENIRLAFRKIYSDNILIIRINLTT